MYRLPVASLLAFTPHFCLFSLRMWSLVLETFGGCNQTLDHKQKSLHLLQLWLEGSVLPMGQSFTFTHPASMFLSSEPSPTHELSLGDQSEPHSPRESCSTDLR